ncbi:MAG: ESPR domain-containing protein, partial [Pseudomonadales bacterium]|nr:ESPR domain-containing protein [Pseudomonadales bacterium]
MNQHLYRLTFNHALGLVMAVAETARGEGKQGSRSVNHASMPRALLRLRPLCWSLLLALGTAGINTAQAQTPSVSAPPAMQMQIPQMQSITLPQAVLPSAPLVNMPS